VHPLARDGHAEVGRPRPTGRGIRPSGARNLAARAHGSSPGVARLRPARAGPVTSRAARGQGVLCLAPFSITRRDALALPDQAGLWSRVACRAQRSRARPRAQPVARSRRSAPRFRGSGAQARGHRRESTRHAWSSGRQGRHGQPGSRRAWTPCWFSTSCAWLSYVLSTSP
jgi:hypothetical protein